MLRAPSCCLPRTGIISLVLTQSHTDEFFELGYTRVPGAISSESLVPISAAIWQDLAEYGIHQSDPETWRAPRPRGFQTLAKNDEYELLFSQSVQACIDALLGLDRWAKPKHWGQVLLSLPNDREWTVPHKAWHLDLSQDIGNLELPGVQVFICIEDVVERCGATVVAVGTHRLVAALLLADGLPEESASSVLRSRVSARSPCFRLLVSDGQIKQRNDYFLNQTHLENGTPFRVDELTGRKGDLILMHPYLFHAPAPNTGPAVRMALTQRIYSQ